MSESAQVTDLKDLIAFCKSRSSLASIATTLESDLSEYSFEAEPSADAMQQQTLKVIMNSLKKQDRRKLAAKASTQERKNKADKPAPSMSKEETENVMENLMNRIAGKQDFINDNKLNAKIESIFSNEAFQRMVDNADIFQDISNQTSDLNQSETFLNNAAQSFQKMLPTSSQLKDDDEPEKLPQFGAGTAEFDGEINTVEQALSKEEKKIDDEITQELAKLNLGAKENKAPQAQEQVIAHDDSFSNLQSAVQPKEELKTGEKAQGSGTIVGEDGIEGINESQIQKTAEGDASSFIGNKSSFVFGGPNSPPPGLIYSGRPEHPVNLDCKEEYVDDDDPGFDAYVVNEASFVASCKELANQNDFPTRAIAKDNAEYKTWREKKKKAIKDAEIAEGCGPKPKSKIQKDDSEILLKKMQEKKDKAKAAESGKDSKLETTEDDEDDGRKVSVLPKWIRFMPSNDEFYPAEFDNVIYDCYNLRMVFDREKTGFEESKDFQIVINSIVAGRYQVVEYLGSAAFSKAIQCYDIHTEQMVCMKIIENNKDYFDQSVDEIKLLRYIQANCEDLDGKNLLRLIDFFYHKEHLFIVTELLRDNLYEYSKYNREVEKKLYFNVPRLQKITKQILTALEYIHNMKLIHCDLKPENILIKSYSRCEIKVIDFGSSCFIHDHLSSYVQSRSYRAPEVILGCRYDYKIDIWSLGCILAELYTGYVLFQNDSVQGLLSRVVGIISPIPEYMMKEGRLVSNFFTREGLIYQEAKDDDEKDSQPARKKQNKSQTSEEELKIHILVSKKTTLKKRMNDCPDAAFVDFVRWLLEVDPLKRPTAKEALAHPWLTECQYEIETD